MVFRDGSGVITIDEAAAKRDIMKIEQAENYLEESRVKVLQMLELAEGMTGNTAAAIRDKAEEMRAEIDSLRSKLNASKQLIRSTVIRYQLVDSSLASFIGGGGR